MGVTRINRALMVNSSETQMNLIAETEALRMKAVDAYIGMRGSHNIAELSDVPAAGHKLYQETVWICSRDCLKMSPVASASLVGTSTLPKSKLSRMTARSWMQT